MAISTFDLFTIGIGPSSSHTVGPMRAANQFVHRLEQQGLVGNVSRLTVHLYGSLGATGRGHGTDKAIVLGLEGELPETVDVDTAPQRLLNVSESNSLRLCSTRTINFSLRDHLVFEKRESLPGHPNGMRFAAFDEGGSELLTRVY